MNQVDSKSMTVNGVPVDEMSEPELQETVRSLIRDLDRTRKQKEECRDRLNELLGIS